MTSREQFEAWMTDEQWFHGSDFEWDERRNCYSQFGIHLAYKAWQAASKASEQQLAAVVAECASVKAMNDCLSEELRGYESDGAFEGPKMHLLWWQCETPETDAAIANIQAHGVEMFASSLKVLGSHEHPYSTAAKEFAAQLRQGAAL